MNDKKINSYFKSGHVEKAFSRLYTLFPKVEKYILQNSGSKSEALDIFQDGLVLLHQKAILKTPVDYEGFLVQSCKYLWQNELRKKKVRFGDESALNQLVNNDDLNELIEREQKFTQIEQVLKMISEKCRTIFNLFYYKQLSMAEVAKAIGFKSVQSTKVQKYKCMEHARNLVLNQQSPKH